MTDPNYWSSTNYYDYDTSSTQHESSGEFQCSVCKRQTSSCVCYYQQYSYPNRESNYYGDYSSYPPVDGQYSRTTSTNQAYSSNASNYNEANHDSSYSSLNYNPYYTLSTLPPPPPPSDPNENTASSHIAQPKINASNAGVVNSSKAYDDEVMKFVNNLKDKPPYLKDHRVSSRVDSRSEKRKRSLSPFVSPRSKVKKRDPLSRTRKVESPHKRIKSVERNDANHVRPLRREERLKASPRKRKKSPKEERKRSTTDERKKHSKKEEEDGSLSRKERSSPSSKERKKCSSRIKEPSFSEQAIDKIAHADPTTEKDDKGSFETKKTSTEDNLLMGIANHDIIEFLEDDTSSLSEEFDDDAADDPEFGERPKWVRSAPAELYYEREVRNAAVVRATPKLRNLCQRFSKRLVDRGEKYRNAYKKKREKTGLLALEDNDISSQNIFTSNQVEKSTSKDEILELNTEEDRLEKIKKRLPLKHKHSHSHCAKNKHTCESPEKKTNTACNGSAEPAEVASECLSRKQDSMETGESSSTKSIPVEPTSQPTEEDLETNSLKINSANSDIGSQIDSKDSNSALPNEQSAILRLNTKSNDLLEQCLKKPPIGTKKLTKKSSEVGGCPRCAINNSSSSSDSSDDELEWLTKGPLEMERKRNDPDRLHPDLWFNDPGQMNDGPLCRCSAKARRSGIRHGYFAGEDKLEPCEEWSNNSNRLYHYIVTISPPTNFLIKNPTVIVHDDHEFIFEGFSILSHSPLEDIPPCKVLRFNTEYTIYCLKEGLPQNYCINELQTFFDYFFKEILELKDFSVHAVGDEEGCPRFHFMPRFVRSLKENGKEVLSMNEVLNYLLKSSEPLIKPEELFTLLNLSEHDWLNLTDPVKGMIMTFPGKKPSSIRVDQIDRGQLSEDSINYPVLVHFGIRPPQLSYAGDPVYQKAMKNYVKARHLLANMPKPSVQDLKHLEDEELKLLKMRTTSKIKRDVTVAISSQGAIKTGIMSDMVQHALLIPVLVRHLRFHQSLKVLENNTDYVFKNKSLLQLALTHPSFRENFGTNPDHGRNSLSNCGVRQPQYGDRKIHYMNTHKRGINTLINIMSRFGKDDETDSKITHNERLEFLGDAVVEFLTSIHLFHLFPVLEEGGLATYRAAIVQNQQLSELAEKLNLNDFVLRAHGSDLCHQLELKHAMANCFEALMGAIFIDSSIEDADAVFSATLFKGEPELHKIWKNYSPHPLQEQEPNGDRQWIETFPFLQKLAKLEEDIGIQFNHIRLLARAFTDRSIGFNYLTLGSNQRLEFLGDTVLQLVASEYLYKFFPEHHEGHLSLLRSSLVNNRTQAVVCDELDMTQYSVHSQLKSDLKIKDRADLLEAFIGALYIDKGLDYCRTFSAVCFFPKLEEFIVKQNWNDPKSKLQQCCLTLRTMVGGEPDIPVYKVIACKGPTNTRVYTVAVYFRDKRLAKASGHSIQQAEMNAASDALDKNKELFPHLMYQQRVIDRSSKVVYDIEGSSKGSSTSKNRVRDRDRRRSDRRRGPDSRRSGRTSGGRSDRSPFRRKSRIDRYISHLEKVTDSPNKVKRSRRKDP